jgi:hypothetical protein
MKLNRRGCTRLVLELRNVVIKFPNFTYSWEHFLKGLIGNIKERNTYRWSERKDLLAPVLWCSWGGWVLIMQKADVERHRTEVYDGGRRFIYPEWSLNDLDGDDKPENFGYIDNKLVKVDYGK